MRQPRAQVVLNPTVTQKRLTVFCRDTQQSAHLVHKMCSRLSQESALSLAAFERRLDLTRQSLPTALSVQIALLKARLAADRANGGIFVHIVKPASTLRSSVRDDDMLLQQNLQ